MTFCLRFGCLVAAATSLCGPFRAGNSGTSIVLAVGQVMAISQQRFPIEENWQLDPYHLCQTKSL